MANILVLEDSEFYRETIKTTLDLQGNKALEANDPQEAMEILDSKEPVDLLVADYHLPGMDGLTFIEGLRKKPGYAKLPIIMCTTESNPSLVKRSKALGINVWLIKPYSCEQFLSTMQKLLKD